MKFRRAGVIVCLMMLAAAVCPGATWFVATNGTDGATPPWGASWDFPFATISNAAVKANATAGSLVLISNGIYYVTNQITISNGVTCRGFSDDPRDVIVDGSATSRCFYLLNGILAAVTMTNGKPLPSVNNGDGGGIFFGAGGGVVSNCIITGNTSARYGGGAYLSSSGSQILRSVIQGNFASTKGGGLYLYRNTMITDCTIAQNTTTNTQGAGILDDQTSSTIVNCQIISNTIATPVGVIGNGAGSYLVASFSTYSNCVFAFNGFTGGNIYGGGIYTSSGGSPRFVNCLIYSNLAYIGGGFYNHSSSSSWFNCTFAYNRSTIDSTASGGGMYFDNRATVRGPVVNCIMYGNMSLQTGSNYFIAALATPTFSNCCAMPILAGGLNGNIAVDPLFQSPAAYNFRPGVNSLCINAGLLEDFMMHASDLDGKSRVDRFNRRVDMGCYEFIPPGTMFGFH